jgi:hypothetical protein
MCLSSPWDFSKSKNFLKKNFIFFADNFMCITLFSSCLKYTKW